MKNLQEDIKTGNFKNAYLLFGEEAYLKIQYKEKLIHALNPDDDTMNFNHYEGRNIDVNRSKRADRSLRDDALFCRPQSSSGRKFGIF